MQRVYEENEWGKVSKRIITGKMRKGGNPIVTRAQGKQDPENHIQALPTVASTTDAGYGTINRTPTFCGI